MRKYVEILIKLGMTAVALVLVFSQVDLAQIIAEMGQAQPLWVLLVFMLVNASMVVRAYRWHLLLLTLGVFVRFGRLVELYFAAGFFNSVLPFGLAGDVVRTMEVAQDVPTGAAAGTVIVDRLTGLLALFALGLLALPFRPDSFPSWLLWQISLICSLGLLFGFVLLEGRAARWFGRWAPGQVRPLWHKVDRVLTAVEACGWRAIWAALAVSIVFNFMQIAWWWAAGKALGYEVPFSYYFFTTPLMALAILLPSVGGLGVREVLASVLFVSAGVTPGEAVALSLLVFTLERVSGLLGAPVYVYILLRRNRRGRNTAVPKS